MTPENEVPTKVPNEVPKPPELQVKNFDIIVPTHGHLDLTINCLNALYANTVVPFHLIIIDDSDPNDPDPATSLTPEYFERLKKVKDNITYIHSPTPYKEGNSLFNAGFEHCKYDFCATVMNSVEVEPNWERVALQFLYENPKVGITGLKQLLRWGPIESAGVNFIDFVPVDIGRDHPSHRFTSIYECRAVAWALAIVRKEAAKGQLPEGIYQPWRGWDDLDNCFILRKNGWRIFYCGYGCGFHSTRATRGSNTDESAQQNRMNAETFFKRWGLWEQYRSAVLEGQNRFKAKLAHIKKKKRKK